MKRIKSGEVFAFYFEEKIKYGLIQVIEKSKLGGYNVRVFYYLTGDLSATSLNEIIESDKFYYIRDFYPQDLRKSNKELGIFKIPDFVQMPRYARIGERKMNGDLLWSVFDADKGRKIKTYKKFDEKIRMLSPNSTWGIEYIRKRWLEEFTLEKWDDDLENQWYNEYLKRYEPDKLKSNKILYIKPTVKWDNGKKFNSELINKIDKIFDDFINALNERNLNKDKLYESINQIVTKLNDLNNRYLFIETEEREEIVEFMSNVLQSKGCKDQSDYIDSLHKW